MTQAGAPRPAPVEYGYRVPFGGIHVFIGKIGEPGPELDICTDLVETAQRARSARVKPVMKRAFVEVIHGGEYHGRIFGIIISQKTAFVLTSPRITVS